MNYTSFNAECQEVDFNKPLEDRNKRGRKAPWAEHRDNGEILSFAYMALDASKAARLRTCAPRLVYEMQDEDGQKRLKLHTAWFCRVRLCPVCQWRRSLKMYGQAAQVIEAANKEQGYSWIMLTLTVKNVVGDELSKTIDEMGAAWQRLTQLKAWKNVVIGSMRSMEVTRNTDRKSASFNTYHPHYHALLCVKKSYFQSKYYMKKSEWAALWRQSARLDYDPQVWVERVKSNDPKAIAEVAKYSTKPGDYIDPSDIDMMLEAVTVLDRSLNKRRMVAWAGNLKEIHAQLHLDDIEDGDLVHTDISPEEDAEAEKHLLTYQWVKSRHNYFKEV